jgi:MinD-like ATPase involved in chromosome partitioning or flagellar assembly
MVKQNSSNQKDRTEIITIISNKGGVGKTTIAVMMGMYYAQKFEKKTLLLEFDSSPGDFGPLFDIESEKSLEIALKFPEKFKNYTKNISKNLDAIKGVANPIIAEGIKECDIHNLFNSIISEYNFVIIDTQTIINGSILDVLKLSDIVFIVSDYSIESIFRVAKMFEILTEKFLISKSIIRLIINKKKFFQFLKVWDIKKITDLPVEAFISLDKSFDKSFFLFNRNKVMKTKIFKQISVIMNELTSNKLVDSNKLASSSNNDIKIENTPAGGEKFEFEGQIS